MNLTATSPTRPGRSTVTRQVGLSPATSEKVAPGNDGGQRASGDDGAAARGHAVVVTPSR